MSSNLSLLPKMRKSRRNYEANRDTYKMASNPRGPCLIINNENFGKLERRRGTEKDGPRLKHVFEQLGFEVTLKDDLRVELMERELQCLANFDSLASSDAAVVVILTHGGMGFVYGADDQELAIIDIVRILNNKNCRGLKGKPKMIFLQSCQGVLEDYGVKKDGAGEEQPWANNRWPTESDIFISYATHDYNAALRNETEGGCYARCLAKSLSEHACDSNLQEILQKVETEMRNMEESRGKFIQSTQTKQIGWAGSLYFNPGFPRDLAEDTTTEQENYNNWLEERNKDACEDRNNVLFQERSCPIATPGQMPSPSGGITVGSQHAGRSITNVTQYLQGSSGVTITFGGN